MSQLARLQPTSGPGSGTVTSISAGTGITLTPNPITTTGIVALTVPVVVADGGTGDTSFTAFAPITGGTTSTGALQSAATGISNSGYVLTSTGASSIPTWQAAAGGGITINLDDGEVSGSTLILKTGYLGGTSYFEASGSTIFFTTTDGNNNVGFGENSVSSIRGSPPPFAMYNSAFGANTLDNLISGSYNVALGYNAGYQYDFEESSNILINNNGTTSENNTLRIGAGTGTGNQELSTAYISGINGNTVSNTLFVTIDSVTDQLGTSSGGGGGGITTINVDNSGSVTGSTISLQSLPNQSGTYYFDAASGTSIVLLASDANGNTGFGGGSLDSGALAGANANSAFGENSLGSLTAGSYNTAIGYGAGSAFLTGSRNGFLGYNAGQAYTAAESDNLLFNDYGVLGDNQTLRIQTAATSSTNTLNAAFMGGVNGNNSLSLTNLIMTIDSSTEQLGSAVGIIGATNNVIIGQNAGNASLNGGSNVSLGASTFASLTIGTENVAIGLASSTGIVNGQFNCAVGTASLLQLISGAYNVAVGGNGAGLNYTGAESSNISINANATTVTGESNTLRIGDGTGTGNMQLDAAYVSGIQGITVTGTAVLVSSSDQLGIAVSSKKYKENIADLETSDVLKLRPVTFNYKVGEDRSLQSGLIAEEVAEIMPQLVVYDQSGEPQSVKYHDLPVLLLNEIQKLRKELDELKGSNGSKS